MAFRFDSWRRMLTLAAVNLWSSFKKILCRTTAAFLAVCLASSFVATAADVPKDENYNQWKRALGTNAATSAAHFTALPVLPSSWFARRKWVKDRGWR
jgi:hypothetical protein